MWPWFTAALADDLNVPAEYPTVQDAVDGALPDDRVVVAAGTFAGQVIVTTDVEIVGAGIGLTVLEHTAEVVLVEPGASARLADLSVTTQDLDRCLFVDGGVLALDTVQVFACDAGGGSGGGLEARSGSVVDVRASAFENNAAKRAPHLFFDGTLLTVSGTRFYRGTGLDEGGVFGGSNADLTLTGSVFEQNEGGTAGAVSFDGGHLRVEDSLFADNLTSGNGAALEAHGADRVTLLGNRFFRNVSTSRAGGVDLADVPDVEVRRNVFCANSSGSGTGGAVRLFRVGDGSDRLWANNVFAGNSGSGGGAVYVSEAQARFENDTFVGNDSAPPNNGGVLLLTSTSPGAVEVVNSVVVGTVRGHGVWAGTGASTFTTSWSDWWTNTPGDYGGDPAHTFVPPYAVDPQFRRDTGDCDTDAWWSSLGNPLIDAGDPAILDADGGPSDLGAYGGPDPLCQVVELYRDLDGDGWGAGTAVDRDCVVPLGFSSTDLDCDDSAVGVTGPTLWYADVDGDGLGDPADAVPDCDPVVDRVADGSDCDDLDDQVGGPTGWFVDGDGDGWGDLPGATACDPGPDEVAVDGDCDDLDPAVSPGEDEVCAGGDEDCDALTGDADPDVVDRAVWHRDLDHDGFGTAPATALACVGPPGDVAVAGDCEDGDPAVNPAATEVCGGVDEDCDALADDLDPSVDPATLTWFYPDLDDDGWGDQLAAGVQACAAPPDTVADDRDCDDLDEGVFPGALELCNGVDDDCDTVDDDGAVDRDWFQDTDGDGYGDDATLTVSCDRPAGPDWVLVGGDCEPALDTVNPGAVELCNLIDDDCDTLRDEGFLLTTWYRDEDLDDYGRDDVVAESCTTPGPGWSVSPGDCADADDTVNPGAAESCDGVDQDCDLQTDEDASDAGTWWPDGDEDGYGAQAGPSTRACAAPPDTVADATDCDDTRGEVHPGTAEVPGNGLDDDCDPATPDAGDDTGLPHSEAVDTGEPAASTGDTGAPTPTDGGANGDPGCGCASGPSTGAWPALLGLLALRRRR